MGQGIKRSGFLVGLDSDCWHDENTLRDGLLRDYQTLLEDQKLGALYYETVEAVCSMAAVAADNRVSQAEITEHCGATRSALVARMNKLLKGDLATKTWVQREGRRPTTLYILRDPASLLPRNQTEAQYPESILGSAEISQDSHHDLVENPFVYKGESFSVFTLFAALPSGSSGPRTSRPYETTIHIGNLKLNLMVRPTAGTRVASVLDLRVLIIFFSRIIAQHSDDRPVGNPFRLDLDDILDAMHWDRTSNNRTYVRHALSRWESTGFQISSASRSIVDHLGGEILLQERFRFITRITALTYRGRNGDVPGEVLIHVDEMTLKRLLRSDRKLLRTVADDVVRERNPTALKLYLWARRYIQADTKPRQIELAHLHRELEPERRPRLMREAIQDVFKERFDEQSGAARLYNYLFTYHSKGKGKRGSGDWISIWADPKDRLVRDATFHKTRQLQNQAEEEGAES